MKNVGKASGILPPYRAVSVLHSGYKAVYHTVLSMHNIGIL